MTAPQDRPTGAAGGATRDAAFAIEALIARLLVIGTYTAVALVLAGVLGMLITGVDPLDHGTRPAFDPGRIVGDLLALHPQGFLWAGLVTVIALPIGRVVVAGLGFFAARDLRLAVVSLLVLLIVLTSILSAIRLES